MLTVNECAALLRANDRFCLLTHTRPDGDTLCSAAALCSALRRMGMEKEPVDVILSGSVFKCRAPMLYRSVRSTILAAAPRARIVESALEPVVGAVLLALDELGAGDADAVYARLERDARRYDMIRNTTR